MFNFNRSLYSHLGKSHVMTISQIGKLRVFVANTQLVI